MKNKFRNFLETLNARMLAFIPYFLFALLFIIIPMGFIAIKAFIPAEEGFDNWAIMKEPETINTIMRSLLVGFLTAFFAVLISLPYAFIVSKNDNKIFKSIAITFIISPLFVFTISKVLAIKGIAISLFGEESTNSLGMIVFGLVYLNIPFATIPLYSVMNNMPNTLLEASSDLGHNTTSSFIRVVLPYSLKAIFASFAIVFMLSASSIVVTQKLASDPNSVKLIGNVIDNLPGLQTSKTDQAYAATVALSTILIMTSICGLIYSIPKIISKTIGGTYA